MREVVINGLLIILLVGLISFGFVLARNSDYLVDEEVKKNKCICDKLSKE